MTTARVRPFIFAVLLIRSAVHAREVVDSMTPHVHPDDLRIFDEQESPDGGEPVDQTRLESVVWEALRGLEAAGILRFRPEDSLFVLASNHAALSRVISVVAALDATIPDHLLADLSDRARLRFLCHL